MSSHSVSDQLPAYKNVSLPQPASWTVKALRVSAVVFAIVFAISALVLLGNFVPALNALTSTMAFMGSVSISGGIAIGSFVLTVVASALAETRRRSKKTPPPPRDLSSDEKLDKLITALDKRLATANRLAKTAASHSEAISTFGGMEIDIKDAFAVPTQFLEQLKTSLNNIKELQNEQKRLAELDISNIQSFELFVEKYVACLEEQIKIEEQIERDILPVPEAPTMSVEPTQLKQADELKEAQSLLEQIKAGVVLRSKDDRKIADKPLIDTKMEGSNKLTIEEVKVLLDKKVNEMQEHAVAMAMKYNAKKKFVGDDFEQDWD